VRRDGEPGVKMRMDRISVEDLFAYNDPCKYHEHSHQKTLFNKEKRNFVYEQPA
jgi:hypothetical protein